MAEVKQDYLVYIPGLTYYSKGPLWVDAMKLEASISGNEHIPTYINAGQIDLGALQEGEYAFNNNSSSDPSGRKSPADILDIELAQMYEEDGRIALYSTPDANVGAFYDYVEQMADDSEFPGEYRHILTHKEYTEDSQLSSENAKKYASCKNLDLKHHDGIYLIKIDNLNTDIYLKFTFYSKVRSELQNNKITFGVEGATISDGTYDSIADLITNEYVEVGTFESVYNPLTSGLKKINWLLPANLLDMYYDKAKYDDTPTDLWEVPANGDFLVGNFVNSGLYCSRYNSKTRKNVLLPEQAIAFDYLSENKLNIVKYYKFLYDNLLLSLNKLDIYNKFFNTTDSIGSHNSVTFGYLRKDYESLFKFLFLSNDEKDDRLILYGTIRDTSYEDNWGYTNGSKIRMGKVTYPKIKYELLLNTTYADLSNFKYLYLTLPEFTVCNALELDSPSSIECFIPMLQKRSSIYEYNVDLETLPGFNNYSRGTYETSSGEVYNWNTVAPLLNSISSGAPIMDPYYTKNNHKTLKCGWTDWDDSRVVRFSCAKADGNNDQRVKQLKQLGLSSLTSSKITVSIDGLSGTSYSSEQLYYSTSKKNLYDTVESTINPMEFSAAYLAEQTIGKDLSNGVLPLLKYDKLVRSTESWYNRAEVNFDFGLGGGVYMNINGLPNSYLTSGGSSRIIGGETKINILALNINTIILRYSLTNTGSEELWRDTDRGNDAIKTRMSSFSVISPKDLGISVPLINFSTTWYVDLQQSYISNLYKGDFSIALMLTVPGVGYCYSNNNPVQQPVNVIYKNYITGWELDSEGLITKDSMETVWPGDLKPVNELLRTESELYYNTSFIYTDNDGEEIKYKSVRGMDSTLTISIKSADPGLYVFKIVATANLSGSIYIDSDSGRAVRLLSLNKAYIHVPNIDRGGEFTISYTVYSGEEIPYISGIGLYKVDLTLPDVNTQALNSWYEGWKKAHTSDMQISDSLYLFPPESTDIFLHIIFPSIVCAKEDVSFCPTLDTINSKPLPSPEDLGWENNVYHSPYGYDVLRDSSESPQNTWTIKMYDESSIRKDFYCYYLPDNPIYQIEGFYKVPNDLKLNDKSFETIYTEGKKIIGADGEESTLVYSLDKNIFDGVLVKFLN